MPQEKSDSIEITFTALETGIFKDSIGLGDTCLFYYTSEVNAKVGQPIIYVSDADFGAKTAGKPSTLPVSITNEGDYDLIITYYSGPNDSAFTIRELPVFDTDDPLVIKPGKYVEFYVDFNPKEEKQYRDSIKFESNAAGRDNVAVLLANGIKPGLEASPPYSWGRKRIHRDAFPAGPYPVESDVITLENTGTDNVVISDYEIISETHGEAFIFDGKSIKSLRIPAGESRHIDVKFFPKDLGVHELTIKYIDNAGSITRTRLSGYGVVPKYTADPAMFNSTIVGLEQSADTRMIKITNLGVNDWDYADTLNIFDVIPGAGVSDDWSVYGADGFKFDKPGMPVALLPGQSVDIKAGFLAPAAGSFSSEIQFETDAIDNIPAILEGDGAAKGFAAMDAYDSVCIGSQKVMFVNIENNGDVDLTINPLRFIEAIPEFSFVDPVAASRTHLLTKRSSPYSVGIIFDPRGEEGLKTVRLIVEDSASGDRDTSEIVGIGYRINRTVSVTPALQTVEIKEIAKNSIYLNPGRDMVEANITTLKISVSYNREFLQFLKESLRSGFIIDSLQTDRENGQFTFRLQSVDGKPLSGDGELANFEFSTYLPYGSTQISDIRVEVAPEYLCASFNSNNAKIALKSICANDLYRVVFSSDEFALYQPNPNPAGLSGTIIYFSVGFDVWADINIYNVNGKKVAGVVSGEYKAGLHRASVPADQLAPGVYYYTMTAGPFRSTRKLLIAK